MILLLGGCSPELSKEALTRKVYLVRLTDGEREHLAEIVRRFKGTSQKVRRAQILLKADADGPGWGDQEIADAFGCRRQTVENVRRNLCERGFEQTLRDAAVERVATKEYGHTPAGDDSPNFVQPATSRPRKYHTTMALALTSILSLWLVASTMAMPATRPIAATTVPTCEPVGVFGSSAFVHLTSVNQSCLSPDGKLLVTLTQDRRLHVWDVAAARLIRRGDPRDDIVGRFGLSEDGKQIIYNTRTGGIVALSRDDLTTAKELVKPIPGLHPVSVTISPAGRYAAGIIDGTSACVIDLTKGTSRTLSAAPTPVLHAVAGDDGTLVVLGQDMVLRRFGAGNDDNTPVSVTRLRDKANVTFALPLPTGTHAVIGRRGQPLGLCDLAKAGEVALSPDSFVPVRAQVSPDGLRLLAVDSQRKTRIFDLSAAKELTPPAALPLAMPGQGSGVFPGPPTGAISFSGDSRYAVVQLAPAVLNVLDMRTLSFIHRTDGHRQPVRWMAMSADGRLYSYSSDGVLLAWDSRTRLTVSTTNLMPRRMSVSMARGGTAILMVRPDGSIVLQSPPGGPDKIVKPAPQKPAEPSENRGTPGGCCAISDDGKVGVVVSENKTYLDLVEDKTQVIENLWVSQALPMMLSDDGRCLAAWTAKNVVFYDLIPAPSGTGARQGVAVRTLDLKSGGNPQDASVVFTPEWDYVLLSAADNEADAVLTEVASGLPARSLKAPGGRRDIARSIAVSPDGRVLATAGTNPCVRVWDAATGRLLTECGSALSSITSLAFAPDGHWLFAGTSSGAIAQWDLSSLSPDQVDPAQPAGDVALLSGPDHESAYLAMQRLIAAGDSAIDALRPTMQRPDVDAGLIDRLVSQLESDDFPTREEAEKALVDLGPPALDSLIKTRESTASPQIEHTLSAAISAINKTSSQSSAVLLRMRAIHVLERIGTPAARELIETGVKNDLTPTIARRAQDAIRRLGQTRNPTTSPQ